MSAHSMRLPKRFMFAAFAVAGSLLLLVANVFAAASITAATNGTGISIDKTSSGGSSLWTTLTPITIAEVANDDFQLSASSSATIILSAPSGFEFDAAATPSVAFTAGRDIASASVTTITSSTITVTVTTGSGNVRNDSDSLTIGSSPEIRVRPTNQVPTSGDITKSGTLAIIGVTNGSTSFGALSSVAGAATKLVIATPPSANAETNVAFPTQPVVNVADQFGNTVTTATDTVTAAKLTGPGTLSGTTTKAAAAGVANFSGNGLKFNLVGDYTLRFTSGSLASVDSGTIAVVSNLIPSAGQSTVTASQSVVEADGTASATITVTVKDASSTPIPGKSVSLAANAGSSVITTSPATTDGSGVATFTVTNTKHEGVTYTATVAGSPNVDITQTATVSFIVAIDGAFGDWDPVGLITDTVDDSSKNDLLGFKLATSPDYLFVYWNFADTVSNESVELFLDSNSDGTPDMCAWADLQGGVGSARLQSGCTGSLTSVVANIVSWAAPGTEVEARFSWASLGIPQNTGVISVWTISHASQAPNSAPKDCLLGSPGTTCSAQRLQWNTSTGAYVVPGTPDANNSSVVASPTTVEADNTATSTVTVTVRDAGSVAIANKTVTLAQVGSSTITGSPAMTNGSGVATFTVKNSTVEAVVYTATVSGTPDVVIAQQATVDFVALIPDASQSTIAAAPSSLQADGIATSTITVTAKNANGFAIASRQVTLTQGGGSSVITGSPATTNGSGVATFTVTNTTAQVVNYTATIDCLSCTDLEKNVSVTFTARVPDADESTVTASPAVVEADGTTTSTVTVTVKNINGVPVVGVTVSLDDNAGSSDIAVVSSTTNSSGVATFTVKDAVEETVVYSAVVLAPLTSITQTATVTFMVTPPSEQVEEPKFTTQEPGIRIQISNEVSAAVTAESGGSVNAFVLVNHYRVPTATFGISAPGGAIPGATKLVIEPMNHPTDAVAGNRSYADGEIVLAVSAFALDASNQAVRTVFNAPVAADIVIPAAQTGHISAPGNLVLAYWDGSQWVEVPSKVLVLEGGSIRMTASLLHFTLYAVFDAVVDRYLTPPPAASGITLSVWSGGTLDAMKARYPSLRALWIMDERQQFSGYVWGAPSVVNEAFLKKTGGTLPAKSIVLVRS